MLKRFNNGDSRRMSDIVTGEETWIYQFDLETKRKSSVWVFPDEQLPTKVKRQRSVGKKMVATFFSTSGNLATVVLEHQRTVTAKWNTEVWLPKVFSKFRRRGQVQDCEDFCSNMTDNASSHTANATIAFLEKTLVKLMTHPAYSPDLAPCDIFLIPNVKNRMRGHQFPSQQDAVAAYNEELSAMSENEWRGCFQKWFQRMQRCIECAGEYFKRCNR